MSDEFGSSDVCVDYEEGYRAYAVQTSIGCDRATFLKIAHLVHDGRNSTRAQVRGAATDELCERTEELTLVKCRLHSEEVRE